MKTQVERMTKQELLHHWLTGCHRGTEVSCRSKKYRAYKMPAMLDDLYFTGKAGALRKGPTPSQSISSHAPWERIQREVERLLEGEIEPK
jgi:hypothetical protein